MAASYAPAEKQYYDQLFNSVDKEGTGVIAGQDALPFFLKSNLSQQILGEIWAISDPSNNGFLTQDGWYKAARLIGWMQKGNQSSVEESLASKPGPYPTFTGQPPPPPQSPIVPQRTGTQLSATPTGLPPLTPSDKTKFTKIFVGCGPQNGLVSGDKARDVFIKSQLDYEKLGLIWNLADTQQRGSLDLTDFVVGMYLIQSCMANPSLQLPSSLPKNIYEQASGGRGPPPPVPLAPISRQHTGPASPIRPQYTGGALQPQRTGQSIAPPTPPRSGFSSGTFPPSSAFSQATRQQWDVTPEAKAASDRFFSQLDPQGRGEIEGDVAVPFMLQSQLDEGTLATIWDLSDIRHEGKLDKDQFAVAMHLINNKLAGKDLPTSLPNSLIPPNMRSEYGGGQQEVLTGPSSTTKDLFDLFADDPPSAAATPPAVPPPTTQSAFSASTFLSQPPTRRGTTAISPTPTGSQALPFAARPPPPPSDLLGDDSTQSPEPVPDNSAEIGNKQNQLDNTNRHLSSLEQNRGDLEQKSTSLKSQLEELEEKLSAAKVRHEAEAKAVADLRNRVGDQQTNLHNLNAEFIAAESDLSAMRSEKDELEQALLRDKEEVRGLQKKMKEIEEEKSTLKDLLEKLKKETRQQKGMVTIAKKQLSTAETSRDGIQKEIDDVGKARFDEEEAPPSFTAQAPSPPLFGGSFSPGVLQSAAAVPLPATPRALSPAPTGASGRSNNPFDRLRNQPKPQATNETPASPVERAETTSPGVAGSLWGAGAAAAGVVVAGAAVLLDAAKDAVSGEDEKQHESSGTPTQHTGGQEGDPFVSSDTQGANLLPPANVDQSQSSPQGAKATEHEKGLLAEEHTQDELDPFGAKTSTETVTSKASSGEPPSNDPFGVPSSSTFDNFDTGFGDSFSATPATTGAAGPFTATAIKNKDFDADFADFDEAPQIEAAAPVIVEPERLSPITTGIPAGMPKSALPNLRPETERTTSTQAIAPSSVVGTPRGSTPVGRAESVEELASSDDEDEGPEDLEAPSRTFSEKGKQREVGPFNDLSTSQSVAPPAPVTSDEGQKGRRSAPPPPAAKASNVAAQVDDFDPFGAPLQSQPLAQQTQSFNNSFAPILPPGAAPAEIPKEAPRSAKFDEDDDFDFSDLPPAQVDTSSAPAQNQNSKNASAFDDEFAGFDDEFENVPTTNNSGSEHSTSMTKSFEIVSAPQPTTQAQGFDEWGLGKPLGDNQPAQASTTKTSGFSFDDAFGNDFDAAPSMNTTTQKADETQTFAPPPGPPPSVGAVKVPPLPERRETSGNVLSTGPQPDDLEDVKKLCGMGFPRDLVVGALESNGYDFQKALNVLLSN